MPPEDKSSGLLYTSEQPEGFQGVQLSLDPDLYNVHLVRESESCSVMFGSLRPHRLHSPWNSAGQNTGVGGLSLLRGIFPAQESNPGLPHCRQILYTMSHNEPQWKPTVFKGKLIFYRYRILGVTHKAVQYHG